MQRERKSDKIHEGQQHKKVDEKRWKKWFENKYEFSI